MTLIDSLTRENHTFRGLKHTEASRNKDTEEHDDSAEKGA